MPLQASREHPRVVYRKDNEMFETIVWATDGSELADRALPYVTELGTVHNAKIVAVHANELLYGRYGGAPLLADEPDLRAKVERQVAELKKAGFDVELELPTGSTDVAALIAKAAEDANADLIVVGTHGHGGLAAALLGSVARGLLHTAHCPVLAIPPLRGAAAEHEAAGAVTTA
jgi:nucleotide-binding universal stress UspA family protein